MLIIPLKDWEKKSQKEAEGKKQEESKKDMNQEK